MVKCTGRGLVVKREGVFSKVQLLNLVLGVGVFSLLPKGRKSLLSPYHRQHKYCLIWETDFYTPQVLASAALLDNSAPAVYKIQSP